MPVGTQKIIEQIASMPWIQLFLTLDCNLKCTYCSQADERIHYQLNPQEGMDDSQLLEIVKDIPPTHFYLLGGEPLIYMGVDILTGKLMKMGHIVSFITNLALPVKTLENFLDRWNLHQLGFFCVTHHIMERSFEYLLPRIETLQKADCRFLVKYLALPDRLTEITQYIDQLKDRGVGVNLAPLQGSYRGKHYPDDYTDQEIDTIVSALSLNSEGLNLYGGIHSLGLNCRGGASLLGLRMYKQEHYIPCCRGHLNPLDVAETFIRGSHQETKPCQQAYCSGVFLFAFGVNSVSPELQRLGELFNGRSPELGQDGFTAYLKDLEEHGFCIINQQLLNNHLSRWGNKASKSLRTWQKTSKLSLKQVVPCHLDVTVTYRWRRLHLASLPQKWAYIARISLDNEKDLQGPCQFEITLRVNQGKVGLGILHRSQHIFLNEAQAGPSTRYKTIRIFLPDGAEAAALIFRSTAEDRQISSATIKRIVLKQ